MYYELSYKDQSSVPSFGTKFFSFKNSFVSFQFQVHVVLSLSCLRLARDQFSDAPFSTKFSSDEEYSDVYF